jgi:exodeoxyribonuclease VIII
LVNERGLLAPFLFLKQIIMTKDQIPQEEVTRLRFLENLENDNYYYADTTHVSCSMLKHLLKSPIHLRNYLENPPPSTPAMTFGSAFHCLILEPEKFNENFFILDTNERPEKDKTMASKANKQWKAITYSKAKAKNQSVITLDELDLIDSMTESLVNHEEVNKYLSECQREKPIAWSWNNEISCKGKVDLLAFDYLADIKTTAEFGGIDKFRYDCKKYHYDMQAAFYCDAMNLDQFKFIVVGKNAPHDVGVFDVSPEFLEAGRRKYRYALDLYDKYFISCTSSIDKYLETGTL